MALWKTKRANTLRVAFPVKRNGALVTGYTSGITVELLSPDTTVSSGVLGVTESTGKPGVYYVDIPTGFLGTHGIGAYGLVIELAVTGPKINDADLLPLEVVDSDLGDLATDVTLIRKLLQNKLELADGDTGNWILYDDNDSTPLLTFSVTDKGGLAITQPEGAPSRRTRGV